MTPLQRAIYNTANAAPDLETRAQRIHAVLNQYTGIHGPDVADAIRIALKVQDKLTRHACAEAAGQPDLINVRT